jgi:hypothetical protein
MLLFFLQAVAAMNGGGETPGDGSGKPQRSEAEDGVLDLAGAGFEAQNDVAVGVKQSASNIEEVDISASSVSEPPNAGGQGVNNPFNEALTTIVQRSPKNPYNDGQSSLPPHRDDPSSSPPPENVDEKRNEPKNALKNGGKPSPMQLYRHPTGSKSSQGSDEEMRRELERLKADLEERRNQLQATRDMLQGRKNTQSKARVALDGLREKYAHRGSEDPIPHDLEAAENQNAETQEFIAKMTSEIENGETELDRMELAWLQGEYDMAQDQVQREQFGRRIRDLGRKLQMPISTIFKEKFAEAQENHNRARANKDQAKSGVPQKMNIGLVHFTHVNKPHTQIETASLEKITTTPTLEYLNNLLICERCKLPKGETDACSCGNRVFRSKYKYEIKELEHLLDTYKNKQRLLQKVMQDSYDAKTEAEYTKNLQTADAEEQAAVEHANRMYDLKQFETITHEEFREREKSNNDGIETMKASLELYKMQTAEKVTNDINKAEQTAIEMANTHTDDKVDEVTRKQNDLARTQGQHASALGALRETDERMRTDYNRQIFATNTQNMQNKNNALLLKQSYVDQNKLQGNKDWPQDPLNVNWEDSNPNRKHIEGYSNEKQMLIENKTYILTPQEKDFLKQHEARLENTRKVQEDKRIQKELQEANVQRQRDAVAEDVNLDHIGGRSDHSESEGNGVPSEQDGDIKDDMEREDQAEDVVPESDGLDDDTEVLVSNDVAAKHEQVGICKGCNKHASYYKGKTSYRDESGECANEWHNDPASRRRLGSDQSNLSFADRLAAERGRRLGNVKPNPWAEEVLRRRDERNRSNPHHAELDQLLAELEAWQ